MVIKRKKWAVVALAVLGMAMVLSGSALAAAEVEEGVTTGLTVGDGLRILGLALGSGIAIAGAALATGRVQAAVGAGGTGALAEKPELFTYVLILIAIPETLVVFGFVIAILLSNAIG